jgi:hypothetical protein
MIKIPKEYNFSNETILINHIEGVNINIKDLNKCFTTLGLDEIKNINEFYNKLSINLSATNVKNYLTVNNKINYFGYLKTCLLKSYLYTDYFRNVLPKKELFLSKMIPIYYKGKLIEKPIYKNSIKTGRQSIEKGFNYLTLKKIDRKHLTTEKDYALFEIDFVSCEPNFYINSILNLNIGNESIYDYIIKKFNLNVKTSKFKNGLIALLYGAGDNTIYKLSSIQKTKITEIKDYLKINNFKSNIQKEYAKNNMFLNFYNRPILDNNNPVNYWIQSSVADYCCLSFNDFIEKNNYLKLHAFIHDAIIVSCPKNKIKNLFKHKKINENISNITLPIRINSI